MGFRLVSSIGTVRMVVSGIGMSRRLVPGIGRLRIGELVVYRVGEKTMVSCMLYESFGREPG